MEVVSNRVHWVHAVMSFMVMAVTANAGTMKSERKSQYTKSVDVEEDPKQAKENEEFFLNALEEHQGILSKVAYAYSRTYADKEDLLQEIVFQLWKAYPTFDGNSKISTWMHTVAVRTAILPFRRGMPMIELKEIAPEGLISDDPFAGMVGDRLYKFFYRLDKTDKGILALMMEEYTRKEIGAILILSTNAVEKRMRKVTELATALGVKGKPSSPRQVGASSAEEGNH